MTNFTRPWLVLLPLLLAVGGCGSDGGSGGRRPVEIDGVITNADGVRYFAHELVVKKSASASLGELASAVDAIGAKLDSTPSLLEDIGYHRVILPGALDLESAREALLQTSVAEAAEPNFILDVEKIPNDPRFAELWGLAKISATSAWEHGTGSSSTLVAVLDTGVDRGHPDLTANLFVNPGEVSGNGVDDDGNGFVDDVQGWDFANADADPKDDHGHGTHVSGTIGAVGQNAVGVVGVNYSVRIVPIKVCSPTGCQTTHLAEGLLYAAKLGARVANASLGGFHVALSYESAAIATFGQKGGLLVAAAGNNSTNIDQKPFYPASYPASNLVAVAATGVDDSLACFSNYGTASVHVAAPGVSILSSVPGGYGTMSGTSMASPHVAGAAALFLEASPSSSPEAVKNALLVSSAPVAALKTRTMHGRLELDHLLTGVVSCGLPGCEKLVTCADAPCSAHATCTDGPSGYSCACKAGYSGDGKTCTDIDECATGAVACDGNAECTNSDGSFACQCIYGFTGDGLTCADLDECALGVDLCFPGSTCKNVNGGYVCDCGPAGCGGVGQACESGLSACDVNATCTSVSGSYYCNCNPGYVGDGFFCVDVDECTPSLDDCDVNATCKDTPGGHECACKTGWQGDGKTCADADECALGTDDCDPNADCQNSVGSFSCACKVGYVGDGKQCSDVDECQNGTGKCGALSHCVNLPGGYGCECNAGYAGDGVTCADVDECQNGSASCDPHATCKNTVGSYLCTCGAGYAGDGKTCSDVDECKAGTYQCATHASCVNLPGAYACVCDPGYAGDGKTTCVDEDECKAGTFVCDPHASCLNTPGAYACTCDTGYAGNGKTCSDVDECANGTHGCSVNAKCDNTVGGYTCTCSAGYEGDGKTCSDVDECVKGAANCGKNSKCENTPGAYHCACLPGFDWKGQECDDVDECTTGKHTCNVHAKCTNTYGGYMCACQAGYIGDGTDCKEVDECAEGLDDCDPNATCTNTSPGFTCACKSGYSGSGKSCSDVDECAQGSAGYAPGASCKNLVGSYSCTCPAGSVGDGKTCADVDECAKGTDDCDGNAICSNASPGFGCACKPGFTGNGKVCTDVDECALNPGCVGPCVNTPGSYYCTCPAGYAGDGKTCSDIDECANGSHNCDAHATCSNEPGSFSCACNAGYAGTGTTCTLLTSPCTATTCSPNATCTNGPSGFSCACKSGYAGDGFTCTDVDECALGKANCSPYASCTNTLGGFTCACKAPYTGSGTVCDLDECTLGTHNCSPNAICSNTPASFACTCKPGFAGDGVTCSDVDECATGKHDCDPNAICSNTTGSFICSCKPGYSGSGKLCLAPPASVLELAAGGDHACVVLDNGGLRCWGRNDYGELGLGHTDAIGDDELAQSAPLIDVGASVLHVSVGAGHTCVLTQSGDVRCFGRNQHGQLGYGHSQNVGDDESPSAAGNVDLGGKAVAVAAGGEHTCVLLTTGNVRCFGLGVDGQLGHGASQDIGDDETPSSVGDVPLGVTVTKVVAGRDHTCVLTSAGNVRCFGRGFFGALGYGHTQNVGDDEPASAVGDVAIGENVVELAAGWYHTCARGASGAVRCWGYGAVGQLGLAETASIGDDEVPSAKPAIQIGGNVVGLSAGLFHTCARLTTGSVRCFGFGDSGRLGYANESSIGDDEHPFVAGDVNVGGSVQQLALGTAHACALTSTGKVVCWGDGSVGQLGNGKTQDIGDDETPAGNAVLSMAAVDECALELDDCAQGADCIDLSVGYQCSCKLGFTGDGKTCTPLASYVVDVSAGGNHTCALLSTGAVRCFGLGSSGQLGYGNTKSIGDDEAPYTAGDVALGGPSAALALGQGFSCALLQSGAVRCFGTAAFGQLGRGNKIAIGDDETPASAGDLPLGFAAVRIAAGANHACALSAAGEVRCWGLGEAGRLGSASIQSIGDNETPASVPVLQLGGPAVELCAGLVHTCARLANGGVRCWGSALYGQLGYGNIKTIGDDETPASAGDVPLGASAAQIACGQYHTCARLDSGGVRCFGYGYYGAVGHGNKLTIGDDEPASAAPELVLGGVAVDLAAGGGHSCAKLASGSLVCWGGPASALGYGKNFVIGDDEAPAAAGAVPVAGVPFRMALGDNHTCVLLSAGLSCFGDGASGKLGYGNLVTLGDDETPAQQGLVPVVAP
ncbi:MAG: EGF domain-containing protein [Polyangiaceae bacterium]